MSLADENIKLRDKINDLEERLKRLERNIGRSSTTTTGGTHIFGSHTHAGYANEAHTHNINTDDDDFTFYFGRAWLGYDAGDVDNAGFGHRDQRGASTFALRQNAVGKTYLQAAAGQDIVFRIASGEKWRMDNDAKLYLNFGTGVNQFSIDTTLGSDSDDAVPTEKAVKAYIDNLNVVYNLGNLTDHNLDANVITSDDGDSVHYLGRSWIGYNAATADLAAFGHRDQRGASTFALAQNELGKTFVQAAAGQDIDFRIAASVVGKFDNDKKFYLELGTGINEFSTDDTLASDSDDAVPTEQAVKAYVDGLIPSYNLGNLDDHNLDANVITSNDADSIHYFGRALIGYDAGNADQAGFMHRDQRGASTFALSQNELGETYVQAAAGKDIVFRTAGSERWRMDSDARLGYRS